MSIEAFLDLIRQRFTPAEGKTILEAISQDPLVWQFVQDKENSFPYFEAHAQDMQAFSPGSIALWLIEKETGISLDHPGELSQKLPDEIRQRAAKAFQTVINSSLPPTDLMHAGLLALTLRERRVSQQSWQGIAEEIFRVLDPVMILKEFKIWQTPFACLLSFVHEIDEIMEAFSSSKNPHTRKAAAPIFIHAVLSIPQSREALTETLLAFSKTLPMDSQLENLQWLGTFGRPDLQKSIARQLMQTRDHQNFFSRVFSEIETITSTAEEKDPLESPIQFSLPERMNRLAAFLFFSGDHERAVDTYEKSSDLINTIKAQTKYQALAIRGSSSTPSAWMNIVNNLPNSKKAHLMHIKALIDSRKYHEANELLKHIPDSSDKRFLEMLLSPHLGAKSGNNEPSAPELPLPKLEKTVPLSGIYVHQPELLSRQELPLTIAKVNDPQARVSLIHEQIAGHLRDVTFLTYARDEYAQAGLLDQAIELASYLERLEPGQISHQRALASLYIKAGRWQNAYSLLQQMIRHISDPDVSDLAEFAESALMTGRIDMASSICQNILKEEHNHPQALILLGKCYMEKGDVVKAIQHMEQVVNLIPDESQTWINLARFWESTGQIDRAFEILRQGILAIPDDPNLLYELGKAHLDQGSPTEARGYLRKVFDIDPANNRIRLNLAQAEYLLGNHEISLKLLEPLSNAYQSDGSIARMFGFVLSALGRTEMAKPYLICAAQQDPSELKTVQKAAEIVLQEASLPGTQDSLAQLGEILEAALKHHPDQAQLKLYSADLDRLMGHHQKAHNAYAQLAMNQDEHQEIPAWRVQYGLGLTSTALGEIEIGLASLQDAAFSEPANLHILHALANTYAAADLMDKALETSRLALKAAPKDIENLVWYASFNDSHLRSDEARTAMRTAFRLAPERLDVKLRYAKTLIATGSEEEPLNLINELVAHEHATPVLLHQASYLYLQAHKIEKAASTMEKALAKAREFQPVVTMDLAVLYTLKDQRKKALEMLDLPEETFHRYPSLALLKADLLSEIGQYPSALNALEVIDESSLEILHQPGSELDEICQSPLLIRYDFSKAGYLLRYGQLMRATGAINQSQIVLEKAFRSESQDSKILNALVGTHMASLNSGQAYEIIESNFLLSFNPNGIEPELLDLACTQIEILLDRQEEDQARRLLEHPELEKQEYPRLFALKSRLSFQDKHLDQAVEFLGRAVECYHQTVQDSNPTAPSVLFRILANLQSIVYAALEVGDLHTAHQYQYDAWRRLNNQPAINLSYARLILQTAEEQRIAQAAKIIQHSPGSEFLDDKYYQLGKGLLEGLEPFFSAQASDCLRTRLASAFSGQWPSQQNPGPCLDSPSSGAAFILGCDDEDRVSEITAAYPDSIPVLQASAIFTLKTGRGEGKYAIQKAIQIDMANPINHALLGWLNLNEPESAIKSFQTASQLWPDEPEWHRVLADLYTELGDTVRAAEQITAAIEAQPENSAYWQTRAGILIQLNQLEEAKFDLEKCTQLESQDAESWLSMADVNRRLGNLSAAAENINTAVALKPNDRQIAIREIEFLLGQEDYEKAADTAIKRIEADGSNQQLQILLARSKANLGNFDEALDTLRDLEKQSQQDASVPLEALKIQNQRDGVEKTLPALIKLAERFPEHPDVLATLTDWLIQTNRLKEAQETAQTILRIIPDSAEVHLMLGRLQRINGQLDQAIAHLSEAIAYDPDLIDAYLELGKTYQNRQNLEEAIKIFQLGTKADASDPRPYFHAGMALKSCKDYSGAEEMLKQAKKFAPGDANIIRQLGVITALNLINNLKEAR